MSLVTHAQERCSGQPESATCTPVPYFREFPATAGPGNQLAAPSSESSDMAPYEGYQGIGVTGPPLSPSVILSLSLHLMPAHEEALSPLPFSVPNPIPLRAP